MKSILRLLPLLLGLVLWASCGDDDGGVDGAITDTSLGLEDSGPNDAETDAGIDTGFADVGSDVRSTDVGLTDSGTDSGDDCVAPESLALYLVGDSTVASGSGWGDFLEALMRSGVSVTNAARSGRSSKSFYDEGAFDTVRSELGDGDYLLIQFGHNDSKPEEYRRTEPGDAPEYDGTFREHLELYISEARAAGATPILLTPVSRMVFSGDAISRTHGEYALAIRRVALDNDVVLLDLEERSHEVFTALGEEETLRLYAMEGDRTHFPPEKAFRVAEMVADLLRESPSPLRCSLNER